MKRKFANRSDWKRILKKEYKQTAIEDETFTGYISLFVIKKVDSPLFVQLPGKEDFCVADNEYKWLQYTSSELHHSVTVMFNDQDEVVQWYFDIAHKAALTEEGIPYFDDLYLDVVVLPTMEMFLLDEDELEEALENGIIHLDEYHLAKNEAKHVMESILAGNNVFIHRCEMDLKRFCTI